MPELSTVFLIAFVFLIATAVVSDISSLRIPNWIAYTLTALFALHAVCTSLSTATVALHILVGIVALAAGFWLFAIGWMGAGDGKLLAAVALWAGPQAVATYVFATAVAGLSLACVIFLGTYYLYWNDKARTPDWFSRLVPRWVRQGLIPYGFAIGVGAFASVPINLI